MTTPTRSLVETLAIIAFALLISTLALRSFTYAFAAVATLLVALLLLHRPILLVYTLTFMIPISWINLLGERLRVITFLTLIALGYYLSRMVVRKERERFEPLYGAILAYLFFCFLSLFNSVDLAFSLTGMKYYIISLAFGLILILGVRTKRDLVALTAILLGWGVLQALLGLGQSIVSPKFFPAFYFDVFSMDIVRSYAVGGIRRASGTFESGPRLSMFLLLPLAMALTFFFKDLFRRKLWWGLILILISLGLFVSFTRIALVLSPAILVGYAFFEKERGRLWKTTFTVFVLLGIIMVLIQFMIPTRIYEAMGNRFFQEGDQLYRDRFYFLYNAFMAFTEHPFLGYGINTYTIHSWDFMQRFPVPWRGLAWNVSSLAMPDKVPVHNDYGRMLAETGIFSLISFIALCTISLKNLLYAARRAKDPLVESLSIAFTLFLCVMIVYWFFHEYIMEEPFVSVLPFAFSVILRRMADGSHGTAAGSLVS